MDTPLAIVIEDDRDLAIIFTQALRDLTARLKPMP